MASSRRRQHEIHIFQFEVEKSSLGAAQYYGGPQLSRQNQKPHGKNKNITAKTKYLAAKPKTSRQKQNTSRQNQKPHFLKSKLLAKTSLIHVDVHCPQAEVRWHGIACLKDLSSQSNWFK